ncbi:hypothetical protein R3P38DRAFT_2797049 [Favolaschia claudopus]|uniref:Uncharacterized protein n=1 Tax=Favolaschia claudopus TaxID=2862362 RepID=A0AAW0A3V2_9AGAR
MTGNGDEERRKGQVEATDVDGAFTAILSSDTLMRRFWSCGMCISLLPHLPHRREHISSTPLAPFNAPNTSQARCTLDIRCGIDEAGLKPTQEPTFRPASAFLSAVDSRAMCLRNQFGDSPRFRPPSLRARTSFSSSLVRLLKSVFMNLSPPNPLALYMVCSGGSAACRSTRYSGRRGETIHSCPLSYVLTEGTSGSGRRHSLSPAGGTGRDRIRILGGAAMRNVFGVETSLGGRRWDKGKKAEVEKALERKARKLGEAENQMVCRFCRCPRVLRGSTVTINASRGPRGPGPGGTGDLGAPQVPHSIFRYRFGAVLDCTGFTGISELPLQWLKFCAELIPYDSACASGPPHPRFQYNAEIHAKIVPLCCGNIVCSVIKAHSSVTELLAQVPVSAIEKLEHPSRLEHEVGEQFSDISMRLQQMCFPITLHVGETHVRITSVRTQPISSGLSCKSTEIMPTDAIRSVKDDAPASEVLQFLADLETVEMQKLFGLDSLTQSSEYISHDESGDKAKVDAQENLTALLVRILEVTARSRGLLNDWRARWMGLATSSAFQYLPSVQM